MRFGWLIVLTMLLLCVPVHAQEAMPEVEQFWQQAEEYGVGRDENAADKLGQLMMQVPQIFSQLLTAGMRTGVKLLAVVMVCALGEGLGGVGGRSGLSAVRISGALAITALTMTDVAAMIGLGRDTIARIDGFAAVLLPVMALLSALSGSVTGAAVRQGATVLFSKGLVYAMQSLLVPLVYAYVAVSCARTAVGNGGLERLAKGIKSAVNGLLTVLLVTFVGYLTATGAISGSVDMSRVKAVRMAISRSIPVVGGILADAAETVLAGAGVLRGSVGAAGMVVVLVICLTPFLHLSAQYLVYKGTAVVCACVAQKELSDLIDAIGSAFGLVLGMTGASALILLVSVASAVMAVTG